MSARAVAAACVLSVVIWACERPCRCEVRVVPPSDGVPCIISVEPVLDDDDQAGVSPAVLDALTAVGARALDVVLGALF